jgi:DsbC/DsbD-like thiol-disulfide interchange protein
MAGMKLSVLLAAGLPLVAPLSLSAAVKSGRAEADLAVGVASYQPGKAFPVAVRLKLDPGWHTYWMNPGVGGMPVKATWTLPDGWTAGELQQPVPKRFMTGDLPGFGYEGEVVFLVDLTPPAGASGEVECRVKLVWLTCNDNSCVPGDAELSLKLPAGDGSAAGSADFITEAAGKIPQAADLQFRVGEEKGRLTLSLNPQLTSKDGLDLAGVSAFPATPDVVDPGSPIEFKKTGDAWVATVKKNEYAEGPATLLDIVLAGGKLENPLVVSWRAKE